MPDTDKTGVLYPSNHAGPVDDWSKRIYASLVDWPVAREGEWTRWEPGYVLLTITRVDGDEVDPIHLYTADEELTVTSGFWEMVFPTPFEPAEAKPEVVAEHAKTLVEQWFSGRLRTAVLTDASGKCCGGTVIEPGEITSQLRAAAHSMRYFHPKQIEVQTSAKREWHSYPAEPEWLHMPPLSPGQLPG